MEIHYFKLHGQQTTQRKIAAPYNWMGFEESLASEF